MMALGKFDQSDGDKEVEQPMPVAAIPLQVVPPLTTFRRKKHTRTLVSISEGIVSSFQILNDTSGHLFSLFRSLAYFL